MTAACCAVSGTVAFCGGGWTEVHLSRSSHRVPIFFFSLAHGVGWQNIL
jgi:hypothetical protein